MALTMTRTRTQTALTKLVELLSNVKGELEYVEVLLVAEPKAAGPLLARQKMLQGQRRALCATLRQFDEAIDPEQVVAGAGWQKAYRARTARTLARRYLASIQASVHCASSGTSRNPQCAYRLDEGGHQVKLGE